MSGVGNACDFYANDGFGSGCMRCGLPREQHGGPRAQTTAGQCQTTGDAIAEITSLREALNNCLVWMGVAADATDDEDDLALINDAQEEARRLLSLPQSPTEQASDRLANDLVRSIKMVQAARRKS